MSDLWTNISGIKQIVYQAKKFGIQSIFISIQFEIDQIVHAWPNIAVTYSGCLKFCLFPFQFVVTPSNLEKSIKLQLPIMLVSAS